MINKSINNIAEIRFGFYTQAEDKGNIQYLQVRQFDSEGVLTFKADEFILLDQKSEQHLLEDGDVLFVGKGNRLFAWCYRNYFGPAIASSIFFVLRPDQKVIYPEYLAAFLNAPQVRNSFQQLGAGTNIFSIRKSELGAFQIPVLPLQKQKKIAALSEIHQKEVTIAQELIVQKQNLYTAIISKLINQN